MLGSDCMWGRGHALNWVLFSSDPTPLLLPLSYFICLHVFLLIQATDDDLTIQIENSGKNHLLLIGTVSLHSEKTIQLLIQLSVLAMTFKQKKFY